MGLRLGIAFLRSREKKNQILLMYLYYVFGKGPWPPI